MTMKRQILSLLAVCALLAGVATAAEDPQQIVIKTADKVLAQVTERKAELEANNSLIYPLVETSVVPHFDFTAMVRSAMGPYWRQATSQQQDRLVTEFREMLVRTYATALLQFTGQQIEYPPMHANDGETKVMVPTKVKPEGGPPIPINYRLKLDGDRWMVYDVVIDGISLITNYRGTFKRQIQLGGGQAKSKGDPVSTGIDSLIDALANKNKKIDT